MGGGVAMVWVNFGKPSIVVLGVMNSSCEVLLINGGLVEYCLAIQHVGSFRY